MDPLEQRALSRPCDDPNRHRVCRVSSELPPGVLRAHPDHCKAVCRGLPAAAPQGVPLSGAGIQQFDGRRHRACPEDQGALGHCALPPGTGRGGPGAFAGLAHGRAVRGKCGGLAQGHGHVCGCTRCGGGDAPCCGEDPAATGGRRGLQMGKGTVRSLPAGRTDAVFGGLCAKDKEGPALADLPGIRRPPGCGSQNTGHRRAGGRRAHPGPDRSMAGLPACRTGVGIYVRLPLPGKPVYTGRRHFAQYRG